MPREAAEVLRDALALPVEARAALVDTLIDSLDPTVEAGAEEAWRLEIRRRLDEIDRGAVELIPWEEVRARLHSNLLR